MGSKKILVEIVSDFFDFESKMPDNEQTISDFIGFLNAKHHSNHAPLRDVAGNQENWLADNNPKSMELFVLFFYIYRYSVIYSKVALKNTNIGTLDEFSFLIILMTYEALSKTELIGKLVIEKTSGMEVIKRLLKKKLIIEFDNPNDKRSKLVAVTILGKETVKNLLPKMQSVSDVVVENLSQPEVGILSYLLRRLDQYHFTKLNGQNASL